MDCLWILLGTRILWIRIPIGANVGAHANTNGVGRLVNLPKIGLSKLNDTLKEFSVWWEAFRIEVYDTVGLTQS